MVVESCLDIRYRKIFFPLAKGTELCCGLPKFPSVQREKNEFLSGVERLNHKYDHFPPSIGKFKNAWIHASTSINNFMCSVKISLQF